MLQYEKIDRYTFVCLFDFWFNYQVNKRTEQLRLRLLTLLYFGESVWVTDWYIQQTKNGKLKKVTMINVSNDKSIENEECSLDRLVNAFAEREFHLLNHKKFLWIDWLTLSLNENFIG